MTEIMTRNDGLTVQQAADRLGVSYQTIHNWINSGRLPATWIGARILRLKPEDVDALRRTTA
jgi:excisionase family DNA binding protein